jgi:hypothetical protein
MVDDVLAIDDSLLFDLCSGDHVKASLSRVKTWTTAFPGSSTIVGRWFVVLHEFR